MITPNSNIKILNDNFYSDIWLPSVEQKFGAPLREYSSMYWAEFDA
jgi:hypothetical protein